MIVKHSDNDSLEVMEKGDDSLQYASLFIIPQEESARNKARKMLHKRLELEGATTATRQSKSSLLLEITDDELQEVFD